MDESVRSEARMEVSVSFGRFENDALAWEKWSSFSPNKYLEEVGTLSTPGSVAQKKAYFEAHYKRIAAKKAEELEQEKTMSLDMSSKEDYVECSSTKFGLSEEVANESCMTISTNETISDEEAKEDNVRSTEGDDDEAVSNGLMDGEEKLDSAVVLKSEKSKEEAAKHDLNDNVTDVGKDVVVELETPGRDSQPVTKKLQERKNGKQQSSVLKKEITKSNARNSAQKVTPIRKEKNSTGPKKKVVSPAVKPSQAPTLTKQISTSTMMSTSQSQILKKKANMSSVLKSKSSMVGESKRATPTSLHISLSLGPTNSSSMNRKSLIMEQMGDKDIVKRAFKSFQNRTNGFMSDEKPNTVKNVPSTAMDLKTYRTPTKGNEGLRKGGDKKATPRSQPGTRSNPLPSRLYKSPALDKKSLSTFSPTTATAALSSDGKAEKRKEFLKKLEAKSIAREAQNAKSKA